MDSIKNITINTFVTNTGIGFNSSLNTFTENETNRELEILMAQM
jgi:hypothetical protein